MTRNRETAAPVLVLVVDDSAFMRAALSQMIGSEPGFEVATAGSGTDALEKISALNPDVITLDVQMPGLGGLETLRRIMSQFPRPVIMVSATTEKDAIDTFDALAAGAFDCVPKQLSSSSLDISHIRSDLLLKIRAAARTRILNSPASRSKKPSRPSALATESAKFDSTHAIVALGTSTGGPKALQEILPLFPRELSVPIVIVQHMPPGFTKPFAHRMNMLCSVTVREATDGDAILPGVVYIAPSGWHTRVEKHSRSNARICLDPHPGDSLHVPSIDVLMNSVAEEFGKLAIGVIMTGMGTDGAQGMKAIYRKGGLTIAQNEATCAVYGMPRACTSLGIVNRIAPLAEIPFEILRATRSRMRA